MTTWSPEGPRELAEEVFRLSKEALAVVRKYAHVTPVKESATFSRLAGARVFLKYENLQKTGAFKVRGALFKVHSVRGRARGVVAASAGNHAQGVAYAASRFGLPAVIVMPETASISKIDATRGYGAEVVLHGTIYDEAEEKALEIARERGYEFVHAFDDPYVIAGQGTIAFELLEQLGSFDVVVVPVGGGGLISGIASVVKKLRPEVRVVGVEPDNVPKMKLSLQAGKPVTIQPRPTIADGLATKKPGELTYKLVSELVDDIVTVSEEEIAKAIYLLLERGKVLVEGAGAAPVAALISGKLELRGGERVVAIVSGGNIDLNAIYKILLRGLYEEGRIATIEGYVPDYPGQLMKVLEVVARHRGNVLDIIHDRTHPGGPAWHAKVIILLEVPGREVLARILDELRLLGYSFSSK